MRQANLASLAWLWVLICQCPRSALGKTAVWEDSASLEAVKETAGRRHRSGSPTFLGVAFKMSVLSLVLLDLDCCCVVTMPVPGHVCLWSGPADLTSEFDLGPCHNGHARQSLDCRLTLPTVPGPNPDSLSPFPDLTSALPCHYILTRGSRLLADPGYHCQTYSPHSGTVRLGSFWQGHCPVYLLVTFSPKLTFAFGTACPLCSMTLHIRSTNS